MQGQLDEILLLHRIENKFEDQFEKIDALNKYAWENKRSCPSELLDISQYTFRNSKNLNHQGGLAGSLRNSGVAYFIQSNLESSFRDLNKARILFRDLDDKKSEAECLRYLGDLYSSINELDLALDLYNKAMRLSEEAQDFIGIAYSMGCVGSIYFLNEEHTNAQDILFKTYELLYEIDDAKGIADVLIAIGKNHFALNESEQALKCFRISLNISRSVDHLKGVAAVFNNIGLYYLHQNEAREGIHYLMNSLDVAAEIEANSLIADLYKSISTAFESISDFETSLMYFKKHDELKMQFQKNSNVNKIIAEQVQCDLGQIEFEKEIVQLNIDRFEGEKQEAIEDKVRLELLSLVASQSDNIVIIMNHLGEISFANESFMRLNAVEDHEREGYLGKTIYEISNHDDIWSVVNECVSNRKSVTYESLNIGKGGVKFYGSALLTPVFNEKEELINLIVVENDISERKKAEEIIDQKNQDITASITYAKRIQEALYPAKVKMDEHFSESFIINQPKDIVSGDFYWFDQIGNFVTFAVADCTGHGVPGAFMSMIGINLLSQITNDSSVTNPATVLHTLDEKIKKALKQTGEYNETTDGMDLAFFEFDLESRKANGGVVLNFASAYRPLWLIRDGILLEFKPDKQSIGGSVTAKKVFTNNSIETKKGDVFYIFTDGCIDQFGGVKGKKFRTSGLQELLIEIHRLPLREQEEIITSTLSSWKGDLEQVDDILILGFKIK